MVKCAVVGGSGYIGGELIRLLLSHPEAKLVAITANEAAGKSLGEEHPNLAGIDMSFGELAAVGDAETLFLALPNGETMKAIVALPDRRMIDTSADFRLRDESLFKQFYKTGHNCFEKVAGFTYGLPELFRSRIREAEHIAAPGCFATASILLSYPIVAEDLDENIVINAVTGSSGSGVKPKEKAHHPFRADSFFAYETFTHRHIPEIKQALKDRTGREVELFFQPHSGPFVRGIFATAVIKLKRSMTKEQLIALYKKYYASDCFIRVINGSPNIKWVQGTNFCDIGIDSNGQTAVVMAAIDNLLKGGASQAIQCFNIMNGFKEDTGLKSFSLNP
jgi:N-acetyl-gamma-glutamyl-phosphate reductase common form